MLEHILKLYTEKPEELKKSTLKFLLLFNSMLLSFKLYENIVGKFHFLDIKDVTGILNFFTSGKVLVALLIISCSYYLLRITIDTIDWIAGQLLKFIFGDMGIDSGFFQFIMKLFDIVKIDSETEMPLKGKNFDTALEVTQFLNDDSSVDKIRKAVTFKYKEVLLSTTIIYFIVLNSTLRKDILDYLFPIVLVIMFVTEYIIEKMFEYILKDNKNINYAFELININSEVGTILLGHSDLYTWQAHKNIKNGYELVSISTKKKTQISYLSLLSEKIEIYDLIRHIKKLSSRNINYILVMKPPIHKKIVEKSNSTFTNITCIEFETISELRYKLDERLTLN